METCNYYHQNESRQGEVRTENGTYKRTDVRQRRYHERMCDDYWLRQVFATVFTVSNGFLNTQNTCSLMFWAVSKNFILQHFATFDFYMQQFTAVFIKCCTKYKSIIKKKYYKTFSVWFYSLWLHEKELYDGLTASQCYETL